MTRKEIEEKLLDYAVGEVTEAERAEIEAALAADAGLGAKLEELREMVGVIAAAGGTGGGKLSFERREALFKAAVRDTVPQRRGNRWTWAAGLAASAVFAVSAGLYISTISTRQSQEVAHTGGGGSTGKSAQSPPSTVTYQSNEARGDVYALHTMPSDPATTRPGVDPKLVKEYEKRLALIRRREGRHDGFIAGQGNNFVGPDLDLEEGEVPPDGFNTEEYARIFDNPFLLVGNDPLSTFSIDVDTASYANVRRFLTQSTLPPPDAVRIEELVNYFHYEYAQPAGDAPFSTALEVHACPWNPKHRLVRIGLQGKEIKVEQAPATNLVFLLDVSGSMNSADKLPLVKESLKLLVDRMTENDRVAIVVYAGASGLVLPSTNGLKKSEIVASLDRLSAGGSTNGGAGIQLAYQVAVENFIKGGVNRVILCTDGDFNVGVSNEGDLTRLIEEKRKTGVFLSVLGFGTGNYADARMQSLADKGNGNAAYIDTLKEAKKVLVEQAAGTLITIAKDVKIQVEFNPSKVAGYRLIGYENRVMAAKDFNDDTKDAGEIGAGHQVTALYEIVPAGGEVPGGTTDPLKYQKPPEVPANPSNELLTVKLRWKKPDGDVSDKIEVPLADPGEDKIGASDEFEFAASVAAFGMLLRKSEHKGQATWGLVQELATGGLGDDKGGYRAEFVEMIKKARAMAEKK